MNKKLKQILELVNNKQRRKFKSIPQALQFFCKKFNEKINNKDPNPYKTWKKKMGIKSTWDLEDNVILVELDKFLAGIEFEEPSWLEDADLELDGPSVTYNFNKDTMLDQSDWF